MVPSGAFPVLFALVFVLVFRLALLQQLQSSPASPRLLTRFDGFESDSGYGSGSDREPESESPAVALQRQLDAVLQSNAELASQRDAARTEFDSLTAENKDVLGLVDAAHEACSSWSAVLEGPDPAELIAFAEDAEAACGAMARVLSGPSPAEAMELVELAESACAAWDATLEGAEGGHGIDEEILAAMMELATETCGILDGLFGAPEEEGMVVEKVEEEEDDGTF